MRSRRMAALAAGAIGLVGVLLSVPGAGPASAEPGNQGGIGTPLVAVGNGVSGGSFGIFEMSPAHHVVDVGTIAVDLGGFAVDGVGGTLGVGAVPAMVLVRGRDNTVWYRESTDHAASWRPWRSLGGRVVTRPAVVDSGGVVLVVAVGTDGRMYERVRTDAGWSPGWRAVNAKFTGVLALGRSGTGFVVYGRGGDGRLWTATRGAAGTWSAFRAVPTRSGLLLAEPAVAADGGGLFVRGMDGACWVFDPAQPAMGWRSLGGRFESGFSAPSLSPAGSLILGRGLNHLVYVGTGAPGDWDVFAAE